MLRERRLDLLLTRGRYSQKQRRASSTASTEAEKMMRNLFDDLYAWVFCAWSLYWTTSLPLPTSPMDFGAVWRRFMEKRLQPAVAAAELPRLQTTASPSTTSVFFVNKCISRFR